MLYIPHFAKEIGVDSVAYSRLRVDKFSPLRDVIEKTPGCHITPSGELYRDSLNEKDLKRIRKKIEYSFYTPLKLLKIAKKILVTKFFSFTEILSFIVVLPLLLESILVREIQKGRLTNSLKHVFIIKKKQGHIRFSKK